jgi:hypothetical protein
LAATWYSEIPDRFYRRGGLIPAISEFSRVMKNADARDKPAHDDHDPAR